jgi:hypothetical protein
MIRLPKGKMTSQQLVDAVAAAGFGECMPRSRGEFSKAVNADYTARLTSFLADLGLTPLDWIRARCDVKLARWTAEDRR